MAAVANDDRGLSQAAAMGPPEPSGHMYPLRPTPLFLSHPLSLTLRYHSGREGEGRWEGRREEEKEGSGKREKREGERKGKGRQSKRSKGASGCIRIC